MIEQASLQQIGLNFATPQLVVRVDECESQMSTQVTVQLIPFPRLIINGKANVVISDTRHGAGEYVVPRYRCEPCEIEFHNRHTNCSLANSYLTLCLLNQRLACEVRVADGTRRLLECDCSKSAPNYTHPIFCVVVLILLICLSEFDRLELKV